MEPLSDFTSRVFEAGLHAWWYTTTVYTLSESAREHNASHNVGYSTMKALSFSDIEVAFFALILGKFKNKKTAPTYVLYEPST